MPKNYKNQDQWFKIVKSWTESNLTQAEFCRNNNFASTTFAKWKMKYQVQQSKEFKNKTQKNSQLKQNVQFLPITIKQNNPITDIYIVAKVQAGNNLVSIFKGADFQTLEALFKALGN